MRGGVIGWCSLSVHQPLQVLDGVVPAGALPQVIDTAHVRAGQAQLGQSVEPMGWIGDADIGQGRIILTQALDNGARIVCRSRIQHDNPPLPHSEGGAQQQQAQDAFNFILRVLHDKHERQRTRPLKATPQAVRCLPYDAEGAISREQPEEQGSPHAPHPLLHPMQRAAWRVVDMRGHMPCRHAAEPRE